MDCFFSFLQYDIRPFFENIVAKQAGCARALKTKLFLVDTVLTRINTSGFTPKVYFHTQRFLKTIVYLKSSINGELHKIEFIFCSILIQYFFGKVIDIIFLI